MSRCWQKSIKKARFSVMVFTKANDLDSDCLFVELVGRVHSGLTLYPCLSINAVIKSLITA